ncbi:PAS domain S-box protein [candidate division KSB1 bacterium]
MSKNISKENLLQERRELKEKIRILEESEAKYRDLFENSLEGISISKGTKFISANKSLLMAMGYKSFEDFAKHDGMEHVAPESIELIKERFKKEKKGEKVDPEYEIKVIRKDGEVRDVEIKVGKVNIRNEKFIQSTYRDITNRKRIEEALRDSEKTLNSIISTIPDVIYRLDSNGKIIFISSSVKSYGYTPKELIGRNILEIVHPDDKEKAQNRINERRSGKRSTKSLEVRILTKQKKVIPFEVKSRNIENCSFFSINAEGIYSSEPAEGGKFICTQGIARDVSEQRKAQSLLVESEEKYRSVVERANDGFAIIQDGILKYVNKRLSEIGGYPVKAYIGNRFDQFIHPDDKPKLTAYYKNRMSFYEQRDKENRPPALYEAKFVHKDGKVVYAEVNSGLINFEGKPADLVIIRDITERKFAEEDRKKLETHLFQLQKMESIGRLAGGIAHDFGNILTVIMGYADLLRIKFGDIDTPEGKAINSVLKNARRSKALVSQLLGFARKGKHDPVPLNINNVIKETLSVSEKIFEKKINVQLKLDENIKVVRADKNQLDQVLTNISINAKDAMPDGGDLKFKTENVFLDEKFIQRNPDLTEGDYVKLTISDSGSGMTKEVKENIFEPFFTTKEVGKGTGLGLATVYGIIKNHKGHITVDSLPGKGTTFDIFLPVLEEKVVKEKDEDKVFTGSGKILVVDDEEDILELIIQQLDMLGYSYVTASNGKEAVDVYKKRGSEIDIVLLDIIMPKMSGEEAFKEITAVNKNAKILLMSGYNRGGVEDSLIQKGAAGFIQKPFELHEISKIIKDILTN